MAVTQTRRGVSLNGEVYKAAKAEAERRGMSLSHFVEQALRAQMALPDTEHVPADVAVKATSARLRPGAIVSGNAIVKRIATAARANE